MLGLGFRGHVGQVQSLLARVGRSLSCRHQAAGCPTKKSIISTDVADVVRRTTR